MLRFAALGYCSCQGLEDAFGCEVERRAPFGCYVGCNRCARYCHIVLWGLCGVIVQHGMSQPSRANRTLGLATVFAKALFVRAVDPVHSVLPETSTCTSTCSCILQCVATPHVHGCTSSDLRLEVLRLLAPDGIITSLADCPLRSFSPSIPEAPACACPGCTSSHRGRTFDLT